MITSLAWILSLGFTFGVRSGDGLTVQMGGVPVIKGSWWQYYEPGWTAGYYLSTESDQQIEVLPGGNVRLSFRSADGRAEGSQLFEPRGNKLHVTYDFHWHGDHPVFVELTGGMIWAPAFQSGRLWVDGKPQRSLNKTTYPSNMDIGLRAFGKRAVDFRFAGPCGEVEAKVSTPDWTLFDARNDYPQDWAKKDDLFWMGCSELRVAADKPAKVEVDWTFSPSAIAEDRTSRVDLRSKPLPVVKEAAPALPLVPRPKEVKVDKSAAGFQVSIDTPIDLPPGEGALASRFHSFLGSLWQPTSSAPSRIVGRISNLGLPSEGYQLAVTKDLATVTGQDGAGLRNGLYTLAFLAGPKDGRLEIPIGAVRDWPSLGWRGMHMFVGPQAVAFHDRLWDRVLLPLKLNKAVLQCERTDWKATPEIRTAITMSRDDLRREFEMLRAKGVEPIPLIESFGHMEWLFENKQNLDLAINPGVPYTVDPDKPRTKELLGAIWDELFDLVHPSTVHFGLDEVGMRGFPADPGRLTRLWRSYIPWLCDLASKHGARSMLWGDVALGPGEATDATSAESVAEAKLRRAAIPADALVGDWHYVGVSDPKPYGTSLRLWRQAGPNPISTVWYDPNNIRGFSLAAASGAKGVLGTTWDGYSSSDVIMNDAFFQVSAAILVADYGWSGRREMPRDLDYSPDDLLRRLYLDGPQPVTTLAGYGLTDARSSSTFSVAGVRFAEIEPLVLRSAILPDRENAATEMVVGSLPSARYLALAVDCAARCSVGEPVARVNVRMADGKELETTLRYGVDVRSPQDSGSVPIGPRAKGLSLVRIALGSGATAIRVTAANRYAGLAVHGISLW